MFDFRKELNGALNEPLFLGLLLRGYYTTLHYPQKVAWKSSNEGVMSVKNEEGPASCLSILERDLRRLFFEPELFLDGYLDVCPLSKHKVRFTIRRSDVLNDTTFCLIIF